MTPATQHADTDIEDPNTSDRGNVQSEEGSDNDAKEQGQAESSGPTEIPGDDFADAPNYAERAVPERIASALGAYGIGSLESRGTTAIGNGALAIGLSLPTTKTVPAFWTEPCDHLDSGTYVASPTDAELDRMLATQHLAYLSGRAGTGRHTTAVGALLRRPGIAQVRDLFHAPGARLAELPHQPNLVEPHTGYIVRTPPTPVQRLELLAIDALTRHIGSAVIVIGQGEEQREKLSRFLVPHRPPDTASIFLAQLRHRLAEGAPCDHHCSAADCHGQCADMCMRLCREDDALTEHLSGLDQPHQATRLAIDVAAARPTTREQLQLLLADQEAALRDTAAELLRVADESAQSVTTTRTRTPTATYIRCFRLAYAIMAECPVSLAADLGAALLLIMEPVEPHTEDELAVRRPWDGFGLALDDTVPEEMRGRPTELSTVTAPTGRIAWLRERRLMRALLDVAWNDYPASQGGLLTWLIALGDHPVPVVRQRAALAAAVFAEYDTEQVMVRVFRNWASSGTAHRRQAAALGLVQAARTQILHATIVEEIHHWARDRHLRTQDTAARAYLTGLARTLPARSVLDDLHAIGRSHGHRSNPVVAMAIDALATESNIAGIVTAIARWHESGHDELAVHAVRATVELAARDGGETSGGWPLLLCCVRDEPESRPAVASLLAAGVRAPESGYAMCRSVAEWAAAADGFRRMSDVFHEVLTEAWQSPQDSARARFYLGGSARTSPLLAQVVGKSGGTE